MKKIILAILVLASINAFAQPKTIKIETMGADFKSERDMPKLMEWKEKTDTVKVVIVVEAEEGYLKRVKGFIVVKSFAGADPTVTKQAIQTVYNDRWAIIRQEDIESIKQRQ